MSVLSCCFVECESYSYSYSYNTKTQKEKIDFSNSNKYTLEYILKPVEIYNKKENDH